MKTFAICLTALLAVAPGAALASYMCDKRFAEVHGQNCPAGSVWDSSYHACIVTGG